MQRHKILISGHSDDLIVVKLDDGKMYTGEEFSAYDKVKYLRFDDGTIIRACFCPDTVYPEMWENVKRVMGLPDDHELSWCFEEVQRGDGAAIVFSIDTVKNNMKVEIWTNATRVACDDTPDGPSDRQIIDFLDNIDFQDIVHSNPTLAQQAFDMLRDYAGSLGSTYVF